jgi:hypothetical protein
MMTATTTCLFVLGVAALVQASAPAHHLQKRQTTVSKLACLVSLSSWRLGWLCDDDYPVIWDGGAEGGMARNKRIYTQTY